MRCRAFIVCLLAPLAFVVRAALSLPSKAPLTVKPDLSVSVRPDPTEGHDLQLIFTNNTPRKLSGQAVVDMIGNRTDTLTKITLDPRETLKMNVANAQPSGTRFTEPLPVNTTVSYAGGEAIWSGNVYFWSAGRGKPGPPLVLDSAQDWQGEDGTWGGPDDLRATITASYDTQRLLLHADVVDDVFNQPYSLGDIWRGDALQIAVDPDWTRRSDASESTEFGLALTPSGPQVYRWTNKAGLIPGATLKAGHEGVKTIYDASIPWSELGVKSVRPPQSIGFALSLNDNDGKGRRGWMMYGDGITGVKRADRYATLTLMP